jgi:hypothetical protein
MIFFPFFPIFLFPRHQRLLILTGASIQLTFSLPAVPGTETDSIVAVRLGLLARSKGRVQQQEIAS